MAALTNPKTKPTEFAGEVKVLVFDDLTIGSASDTLTLSAADNGVSEIVSVVGCITSGQDAAFTAINVSYSGLVITIASVEQDGTAATDFTGTAVNLIVVVK